jgi:hypothetical protein
VTDMSRPVEPCIKGHPKITGGIEPIDWLTEELNWSGFQDAPTGLREEHRYALRDTEVFEPPL